MKLVDMINRDLQEHLKINGTLDDVVILVGRNEAKEFDMRPKSPTYVHDEYFVQFIEVPVPAFYALGKKI